MFNLDARQQQELAAWQDAQDAKVLASQAERKPHWGQAYYGACGGGYTYSFTPTSLGVIIVVKNGVTGEEIDLSHTEEW